MNQMIRKEHEVMSTVNNSMIEIDPGKMVTIHIDESMHAAMKTMARQRKVLISLLYEQAVEGFLDVQNNVKKPVKKTNGFAVIRR